MGIIHQHTVSDKFKSEQVPSSHGYPPKYQVRPVEAQVTELRKLFPSLGSCMEKLSRKPLLVGAEAWFAIPRWQALASTYNEAVELVLGALATRRKISNRVIGRLGPTYLRQSDRTKLAEKILSDQQQGRIFWWWAANWACAIAADLPGAPVWRWTAMNLPWAPSLLHAFCSPTPSGSLLKAR